MYFRSILTLIAVLFLSSGCFHNLKPPPTISISENQLASVAAIREAVRCSVGLYIFSKKNTPVLPVTLSSGQQVLRQFVINNTTIELSLTGIATRTDEGNIELKIPIFGFEFGPSLEVERALTRTTKLKLKVTVDKNFNEDDLKTTCDTETLEPKKDPFVNLLINFENVIFEGVTEQPSKIKLFPIASVAKKKGEDELEKDKLKVNKPYLIVKGKVNKPYFIVKSLELTSSFKLEKKGTTGVKLSIYIIELGTEAEATYAYNQEVKFSFVLFDPKDKEPTIAINPTDPSEFEEIFIQNPGLTIAVMPSDESEETPCC